MNEVRVGPVNSTTPAMDADLRTYLMKQGFSSDQQQTDWSKTFPDPIAADGAVQAFCDELKRLIQKHRPNQKELPLCFQI